MNRFDKENHKYYMDEKEVPGVTSTLPHYYGGNATEYHRDKGSKMHEMLYLYNMKNLDEQTLDPVLVPYLEGYKEFVEHNGTPKGIVDFKSGAPQAADELQLTGYALLVREGKCSGGKKAEWTFEEPLYHPTYRFAGTPDIVNVEYSGIERDIIRPFPMHCLYLDKDGGYKLSKDFSKDYLKNRSIFLSFLTVFFWKKERGLL